MEVLNVSVDRLTLVGGIADKRELSLLSVNPFVKGQGRAKFPYDYTFYMQDGSVLQLGSPTGDVRPLRYDFNPNKWEQKSMKDSHLMSILRLMKNVSPTRIDVAIDIVGEDLGRFDWRDMRARKREVHTDGVGRVETIYIGSERSEERLRIYNKKKERQDKGFEYEVNHEHWWRVEAQMRSEAANNYLEINPFKDVLLTRKWLMDKDGEILDHYDVRTKAMLYYLQQFPDAITELAPNSRTKYKQMLAALSPQVSEDSFAQMYEDSKDQVREVVDTFVNCTMTTFVMGDDDGN